MSNIKNFRDLKVWHKAHELTLGIYRCTERFPRSERYGLTSQLRRAAASTAANIVEGSARRTTRDLCHFLNIAQASNDEVKYFLILARDLGILLEEDLRPIMSLADEVGAMLRGLEVSLLRSSAS